MIQLKHVVRRFGRVVALDGLEMTVPPGCVYGFIGNNGAGKTTTIHALLGLIPINAGQIHVFGLSAGVDGLAIRRRVGFFPERDEPYEWLRVGQLLQVCRHTFERWDADLAEHLRRQFDLDPRKRIKELSKGMTAKAKLVVTLAHRPSLLVLDEPTSGLDPNSRYDLLDTIRDQGIEYGVTVLFSSHNLDEVERIATRVGVIHRGRMAIETSRSEIEDRFGLLEGTEPPAALRPWILAEGRLGETRAWLVADRHAPAIEAFTREHPAADVRAATVTETFRLVTADTHLTPVAAT